MQKNILMTLAVAGVATFALGACASTEGTGTTTEPEAGTNAPAETEAPIEQPIDAPAESEAPAAPVNPRFGETYTWENGVQVTIDAPVSFTPGEYSLTDETPGLTHVYFDVKLVNGSAENVDPTLLYETVQSGNIEAGEIYDADNLGQEPTTVILPGREAVWKIGYSVMNPADIVMEFTPGMFDFEDAIFTS